MTQTLLKSFISIFLVFSLHIAAFSQISISISDLKQKAKQGDAQAQSTLGAYYYNGEHELKKNYKTAYKYFAQAAAQGDVQAQNDMAACLKDGRGVSQDLVAAVQLFEKAAVQG